MEVVQQYRDDILIIEKFVKTLDPSVRAEAFRFLLDAASRDKRSKPPGEKETFDEEQLENQAEPILQRLAEESGIPVQRLAEVYAVRESAVQVIDPSIPNEGLMDLMRKITLLCTYGNVVGRGIAKVEVSAIYKNLKDLKASTTSYSRDIRKTGGVKVLTDGVMLAPEGREKAQVVLREILKMSI